MAQKLKRLLLIICATNFFLFFAPAVTYGATSPIGDDCAKNQANPEKCLQDQDNAIVKDLNKIVAFLSGLVGVVVVGVIVLGGVQYAMAGDKAEAVSAAKQRIINGLIALFAFLFIYAFLQWLIPGGVFR